MTAALPRGVQPLFDAETMRATDRWAIERYGIPGPELMAAAGRALADEVMGLAPEGPVVIVCGAGNNGGDGYVAARCLADRGRDVRVLSTAPPERLRGDAAEARDRWDGGVAAWHDGALDGAAVIVDAILGTGATGAVRGTAEAAVRAIRAATDGPERTPVVACDIPSGVDASTGESPGVAVRAAVTVTFHAAPPGAWIAPGKGLTGRLVVADIGIPAPRRSPDGVPELRCGRLTASVLDGLATRESSGTKFRSGHVTVVGGSPGMTGAPCLTALGAMRAGAGYVTLAVAERVSDLVTTRAPWEALGLTLPDDGDGGLVSAAVGPIVAALEAHAGTLVIGPGLGRGGERGRVVGALMTATDAPVVVDADALTAVAGDPEALRRGNGSDAPTVLTPHAGELARVLGVATEDVTARRLHHARVLAERAQAIVVLKGDDSLIVAPDGRVAISPGDAPGLATAGTGDVLSGVTGALLARGTDPFVAAAAAVWLHLQAGKLVAEEVGSDGVVASDVARAVSVVRRRRTRGRQ
ncbi:MAG: NAD(P)H-hydrate dehydratase [Patulibacter sp.]